MKPRLLDLFCGAGGAAMGYARAGFEVVGVDIKPQPNYPFEFVQMDALDFLREQMGFGGPKVSAIHASPLDSPSGSDESASRNPDRESPVGRDEPRGAIGPAGRALPAGSFSVIHASPPCQDHSVTGAMHAAHGTGWMLAATIELLKATGLPWIVENVVGPTVKMDGWWFTLCGSMFDLGVRRHRRFGSSEMMLTPCCRHDLQPCPVDVTGHSPQGTFYKAYQAKHGEPFVDSIAVKRAAMGIDWMTRDELAQAIPPAYTDWIGTQLLESLRSVA